MKVEGMIGKTQVSYSVKLLGVVSASRWGVCITAGAKVGRLKHVDHGLKITGESCPILLE